MSTATCEPVLQEHDKQYVFPLALVRYVLLIVSSLKRTHDERDSLNAFKR